MRRAAAGFVLVALGGVLAASRAGAQTVDLYSPLQTTGTSQLPILVGQQGTLNLRVYNNCAGVSSYSVTVFFDASRVRFVSAASRHSGLANPAADTSVAGQVTLAASGSGSSSCYTELASVTFRVDAAAAEGSLLSLKVNGLVAADGATSVLGGHRVGLFEVCQAVRVWGDVDSSLTVTSRDALVALTVSVGTSVSGFPLLDLADVDGDMAITARDALFILSFGVGLTPYGSKAGQAIINRCAPVAPMPNDMVFYRSLELIVVSAGDTLLRPTGVFGDAIWRPAWAPDGSRLAFTTFVSGFSTDIVTMSRDGLQRDTLRVGTAADFAPAWSPDGTMFAFVSSRVSPQSLFVMNRNGTNQVRLTDTMTVFEVGWAPDGSRIVFTGYSTNTCCTRKLYTVARDGSGLAQVFATSSGHAPADPVFSPASDSIAYDRTNAGEIFRVAAAGDTAGHLASRLVGQKDYPGWVPSGLVFVSQHGPVYGDYVLHRVDGRQLRLTRGLNYGGIRADWRRPTTYVNAVAAAPASWSATAPGDTLTFAAVVTDNAGNPITPLSGIQWSSSNTAVVTIDPVSGLATAQGSGAATIFATAGGWRTGSASVTVP